MWALWEPTDWITADCADNGAVGRRKMVQQLALVELTKKHTSCTSEPWVSLWISSRSYRYLTQTFWDSTLFFFLFSRYQHGRRTETEQTQRPEALSGCSLQVPAAVDRIYCSLDQSINPSVTVPGSVKEGQQETITPTNMELLKQMQGLVWDWDLKTALIRRRPSL